MEQLTKFIDRFWTSLKQVPENEAHIVAAARNLGLSGVLRAIWADLFVGRSLVQWLYLLTLSSVPFILHIWSGSEDWTGQFLQSYLYREQWIFWIATNVFSIYLWWVGPDSGNLQMSAMYFVWTINSIVGWYQWSKSIKEGQVAQNA